MLEALLGILVPVIGLAGVGVAYYYRSKWLNTSGQLSTAQDSAVRFEAMANDLAGQRDRALAALKARQETESSEDKATAAAASSSAAAAADLLNKLHP